MTRKSTESSTTTESSSEMPEPKVSEAPAEDKAEAIVGMKPYKFSGRDAWHCPNCKASTTDEAKAKSHACAIVKTKVEEGE